MGLYVRPTGLHEALEALGAQRLTVLAGGTDFYPARVGRPLDDDILDITAIEDLRGIADDGGHWRIGATTTWTDVIEAELPACFDGLKLAAREVGGMQIQNAGTIAGNLCNASPAADGVPPLLALDAHVELSRRDGRRRLPLGEFVRGNRDTACDDDEMVTAILVPKLPDAALSGFLKLGARRYLVISIVMAAGVVVPDAAGTVTEARIAVGACSARALRLPALEAALIGRQLDAGLADALEPGHLAQLAPIDDCRGTADYRQEAAAVLVRRLLSGLAGETAP